MEDHSKLFNEINGFSQRKLKKVETKTTSASGDNVVEKRGAKGLTAAVQSAAKKCDLQVGLIVPGLMIGSQDVAHDKKTLEEYGITHILNLASDEIENKFDDDYNYCSLAMRDDETLSDYFEEAFEFIDEGRFRGNCFVHCDASKPGLSRSTAICVAYLMKKEKKPYDEAYGDVKEARSFVRPCDSYIKQLKSLNEQLFGSNKKEEIEDPFTKKKRQEIEAEKAALKGGVNLKDRVKLFASSNGEDSNNNHTSNSSAAHPPPAPPPPASSGGKAKWNAFANDTGDTSGSDSRKNSYANESIGKVKWNPVDSASSNGDAIRTRGSLSSRTNSVNSEGEGKKLTSIIGLFNKPSQPIEPARGNFTINKNTAPAKKWKTVEPPPPPGFVRRTKSRRFNQEPAVRRIRSRTSLARNKSREMSEENDARDKCSAPPPPPPPSALVATDAGDRSAHSSQRRAGQLVPSETAILTPWRKSSKDSSSASSSAAAAAPPPPPPPPPPARTTIQMSSQVSEPSEGRFRTSYSVSPAKSPEESRQSTPVTSRADSLPPPPPSANRMVFGKVKPPPMKLIGSSLSTEQRKSDGNQVRETLPPPAPTPPPPPPPPVRYDSKNVTDHNNNRNTSKNNNSINNNGHTNYTNSNKSNGHKSGKQGQGNTGKYNATGKHHKPVYDYEESDSESDDESDDDDDYTQIYDHRECPRGLNRSSTKEIISLIKSKTGADLASQAHHTLGGIDENEEIDNLLAGLESEGIENLDWGELGIDLDEVKEIVEKHEDDEEEEEEEIEEEEEEIEVEVEEEEEEEEEEDDKAIAVTYKVNNRPGTRVA